MDEAAASLLLNNNPTPPSIELDPAFVSGESYQIAKVTWLPDYLGNNKSHGGGRVSTSGGGEGGSGDRKCETYGFLSSCPAHQKGSGIKHPVSGLTCYEKCVCDTSYYKYSSSNCASPKVLGGESCDNQEIALQPGIILGEAGRLDTVSSSLASGSGTKTLASESAATTLSSGLSTGTVADLSSGPVSSVVDAPIYQKKQLGYYTTCTCPAEYSLSSCPANANCKKCDSKYKFVDCQDGFTANGNTCVKQCADYTLTVCPTGGTCSECPDNNTKLKLDSCDETQGWAKSGNTCAAQCSGYSLTTCPAGGTCLKCPADNAKLKFNGCDTTKGWKLVRTITGGTCEAVLCPIGYSTSVTHCLITGPKPNLSYNGWSGGQRCALCKCSNVDSTCTTANYPVTAIPANATQTGTCTTGCGPEKITRYKFKCNSGYYNTDNYWCSVPVTDCATLGYNRTTAYCSSFNMFRCPFDETKIACI